MSQPLGTTNTLNVTLLLEEGGLVNVVAAASAPAGAPLQISALAGGNSSLAILGAGYIQTVLPAGALTLWTSWKLTNERLVTLNGNSIQVSSA